MRPTTEPGLTGLQQLDVLVGRLWSSYLRLPACTQNSRPKYRLEPATAADAGRARAHAVDSSVALHMAVALMRGHDRRRPLGLVDVCTLHDRLMRAYPAAGPGLLRPTPMTVTGPGGARPLGPDSEPEIRTALQAVLDNASDTGGHPVEVAATLAHGVVAVHPFADGNGRLSRVLAQAVLVDRAYLPGPCLDLDGWAAQRRDIYGWTMRAADAAEPGAHQVLMSGFVRMLGECAIDSRRRAQRAAAWFRRARSLHGPDARRVLGAAQGLPVFSRDWMLRASGMPSDDLGRVIHDLQASGVLRAVSASEYAVEPLVEIWDREGVHGADDELLDNAPWRRPDG